MHPGAKVLWRYASGELAARRRARVRQHALDCDGCRREIGRALAAIRGVAGAPLDAPSAREIGTWGEELIGTLTGREPRRAGIFDALLGSEPRRADVPGALAGLRRTGIFVALGATTLAIALLAVAPRLRDRDDLVARGAVDVTPLHLRVLCVTDGPSGPEVLDPERVACPVGAYVKLLAGGDPDRRLVILEAAAEMRQVYPEHDAAPLAPEVTPIPGAVRLTADDPGRIRFIALGLPARAEVAPLLEWAAHAPAGVHTTLSGGAVAVVTEIHVTGGRP